MYSINYLAILTSGIVMMILGYLWYGPVFGKAWGKMVGVSEKEMKEMRGSDMVRSYGLMFISTLVLSYVYDHVLIAFQSGSISMALQGAFWAWLGFIATTQLGKVLWEKKPWKLYVIDTGYYLVSLVLVGIVLTLWR